MSLHALGWVLLLSGVLTVVVWLWGALGAGRRADDAADELLDELSDAGTKEQGQ